MWTDPEARCVEGHARCSSAGQCPEAAPPQTQTTADKDAPITPEAAEGLKATSSLLSRTQQLDLSSGAISFILDHFSCRREGAPWHPQVSRPDCSGALPGQWGSDRALGAEGTGGVTGVGHGSHPPRINDRTSLKSKLFTKHPTK